MSRAESSHPTPLELEILKVLWQEAPLPVRDVRTRLATAGRNLAHSSVITVLNIMHRKGLVKRNKTGNAFFFSPQIEKGSVSRGILGDLVNRLFDGSSAAMVLNLFETMDVDEREMAEIRKLLDRKSSEKSS